MTIDSDSLLHVLRNELNAVNQQFFHILALREWGEQDAADRIMQVDNIDFQNAMRIIDYFVITGKPMELGAAEFSPGKDYRSILVSERELEQRLMAAIGNAEPATPEEEKFIQDALNPRKQYLEWLEDNIAKSNTDNNKPSQFGSETAGIVGYLISLVEQSMVHAFVHWHDGDLDAADDAWTTSGAAMMHLTDLVRLFAKLPSVPFPGSCPALDIQRNAADALKSDQHLAALCSKEATEAAARCKEKSVADLCEQISHSNSEFSSWNTNTPHPSKSTNPAAFQSFEMTLSRYVH